MPKICGLVQYKKHREVTEDFIRLAYNKKSSIKKRILFTRYNQSGAFIGLSCGIDKTTPCSIIYNKVKYTYIFDGQLENSREI